MKRDWDLIKEILIKVEELELGSCLSVESFEKPQHAHVCHNVTLIKDAGLVVTERHKIKAGYVAPVETAMNARIQQQIFQSATEATVNISNFEIHRLTWEGQEFLDAIRADSTWAKVKTAIVKNGGSLSFEVLKSQAIEWSKALINT